MYKALLKLILKVVSEHKKYPDFAKSLKDGVSHINRNDLMHERLSCYSKYDSIGKVATLICLAPFVDDAD